MREKLGADSDDSDFDSDGDAAGKPAKTGAKKTTTDTQGGKSKQKMSQGYNYFMSKAGKGVEESSEVEFTEESQQQSIAKVEESSNSYGTSLQDSKPKTNSMRATTSKASPAVLTQQSSKNKIASSGDTYGDSNENDDDFD